MEDRESRKICNGWRVEEVRCAKISVVRVIAGCSSQADTQRRNVAECDVW